MSTTLRIVVVEDHAAFRARLVRDLSRHPGWQVVGEFSEAAAARREIPALRPDLLLLDLRLPGACGIDLIRPLRARLPQLQVLLLTIVDDAEQIVAALEAGACGYLLKGGSAEELCAGIADAVAGGATMSPAVARRLVEWFRRRGAVPDPAAAGAAYGLSAREWEVLRLAARGRQQGEISAALGIAVNTVKNHFRNIYAKLGVGSLTDALVKLNRGRGLLDER